MSKGFDKIFAKPAVQSHSKLSLDRTHLTTLDVGQIMPLFFEETIPGDSYNVNGSFFARMAPLKVPTYGKCDFKTASFFVPYHQIAEDADAYLAGKTTWQGVTPLHRYITVDSLFSMFTEADLCSSGSEQNCSFTFIDSNGVQVYKRFTPKGRYFYKVVTALGYQLPSNVDYRTTSDYYVNVLNYHLSAYPILAFAKAYNDWMSQSQRFNTSELTSLLYSIKYNNSLAGYYAAGKLNGACLKKILESINLNYENDYFISAWQAPNSPINNTESVTSLLPSSNIGLSTGSIQTNKFDSVYTESVTGTRVTERALQILRSFDNWVRRHNYAGSREVQQIYAQFGIKSDQYKAHFAQLLNTSSSPMQVGDIMSMADTGSYPLADYAGKGIVNGDSKFSIKADDYGMILSLGWITVKPMNPYGFSSVVLKNKPLDWYNPEFDGIGAKAIPVFEYFSNPKRVDQTNSLSVYGFTERYNDLRWSRDQVTGDFRVFAGMDDWHFSRDLSDVSSSGQLLAQSTSVMQMPVTNSEYNRIFNLTDSTADHFYMTAQFKVNAVRPIKSLSEVANLGEGNLEISRNGNEIN